MSHPENPADEIQIATWHTDDGERVTTAVHTDTGTTVSLSHVGEPIDLEFGKLDPSEIARTVLLGAHTAFDNRHNNTVTE